MTTNNDNLAPTTINPNATASKSTDNKSIVKQSDPVAVIEKPSTNIITTGINTALAEKMTTVKSIVRQTTLAPIAINVFGVESLDQRISDLCRIIACTLASRDHETASASVIGHYRSATLCIRGIKRISAQILRPRAWGLDEASTDLIQYCVFDATTSDGPCLRITLSNKESTPSVKMVTVQSKMAMNVDFAGKATKRAAARAWEEPFYGNNRVLPADVEIPIQGSNTVPSEILPVANAIVKEAVASALLRDGKCTAKINPYDKPGEEEPSYVITITGFLVFSIRTVSPKRYWTKTIPRKVLDMLSCFYDVATGEHRIQVPLSAASNYILSDVIKRNIIEVTNIDNNIPKKLKHY